MSSQSRAEAGRQSLNFEARRVHREAAARAALIALSPVLPARKPGLSRDLAIADSILRLHGKRRSRLAELIRDFAYLADKKKSLTHYLMNCQPTRHDVR